MTAATLEHTTATAQGREVSFRDTLASEWIKLKTLRSTYITLGLGFSLSVAATGLFAMAVGNTYDGWSEAQQASFEPLMFAMVGNVIALIVATVFGVMTVSGEYANGMVRQSMIATPRRTRVLWSKVLLVFGITTVLGLATVTGMFLVGQAVLGAYGLPTTSLEDPDALRLVIGLGAATPLFPVIGLALGFILRSTAGAITAALALLWLPLVFNDMLPAWAQENILTLLPGQAVDSFTIAHAVDVPTNSPPLVGVVLVIGWLTLFLGSAQLLLRRRDV
ncbi:MAG: ABC transporter permease [Dehalococcoidia bacterium]|nr:ABC transporter permease [Dehalococcoidia bacterium]MCB9482661.1 ABC transporter permease [Dehalococcoidia bacterium]MCB9491905.1 ABC transporter permease [Dehalococcoidia bacterium]